MLDLFNFPVPQNADYQEFLGGAINSVPFATWVKPRGAGMVMFLLIGAGAPGSNGSTSGGGAGGGSGAVTRWIGPAIFVPDSLKIIVSNPVSSGTGPVTQVVFGGKANNYVLLQALSAVGQIGGTASTNSAFGTSGIYTSVAGIPGASAGASLTASTTTFLSGGAGGASVTTNAGGALFCNYGYPRIPGGAAGGNVGANGFFIKTPLMLGAGGTGGGGNAAGVGGAGGDGGIGCGGGGGGRGSTAGGAGGKGGQSAVFIWSW